MSKNRNSRKSGSSSNTSKGNRSAGSSTNNRPTTAPTNNRPTTVPTNNRPTTAPTNNRPTTAPTNNRPTTAPANNRPTTAPTNNRPTTAPTNNRPTTAPANNRPTTAPTNNRPTTAPVNNRPATPFTGGKPTVAPKDNLPTRILNNTPVVQLGKTIGKIVADAAKYVLELSQKKPNSAPPNPRENNKHIHAPSQATPGIYKNNSAGNIPSNNRITNTTSYSLNTPNLNLTGNSDKDNRTLSPISPQYSGAYSNSNNSFYSSTQNNLKTNLSIAGNNYTSSRVNLIASPISIVGNKTNTTPTTLGNNRYSQPNNQKRELSNLSITADRTKLASNSFSSGQYTPQSYLKEQDILDPFSRKIVSRTEFERGINKSIELVRQNLYKPGAIIKDPISGKNIDIYTLAENNEKRFKLLNNINTSTSLPAKELELSDALSIAEGGLQAAKEFISDHGLNSKLGFWVQATGGAGKLVTYGQIGVEMTTGDQRKAAGMLLAEGISISAGVATANTINRLPIQHPIKNATAIIAGTAVGLGIGNEVTSKIETLTEAHKQAEKVKASMASSKKSAIESNSLEIISKPENINLIYSQEK